MPHYSVYGKKCFAYSRVYLLNVHFHSTYRKDKRIFLSCMGLLSLIFYFLLLAKYKMDDNFTFIQEVRYRMGGS